MRAYWQQKRNKNSKIATIKRKRSQIKSSIMLDYYKQHAKLKIRTTTMMNTNKFTSELVVIFLLVYEYRSNKLYSF